MKLDYTNIYPTMTELLYKVSQVPFHSFPLEYKGENGYSEE